MLALLILLIILHLIFRDGIIAGCLGLIVGPVILVIGFNVVIAVLEWLM